MKNILNKRNAMILVVILVAAFGVCMSYELFSAASASTDETVSVSSANTEMLWDVLSRQFVSRVQLP
jgi:hypothetical protein